MNFWTTMLATMCGILLWDILVVSWKIGYHEIMNRREEKTRKIGFGGDAEIDGKKPKGATMRKIGFGAND